MLYVVDAQKSLWRSTRKYGLVAGLDQPSANLTFILEDSYNINLQVLDFKRNQHLILFHCRERYGGYLKVRFTFKMMWVLSRYPNMSSAELNELLKTADERAKVKKSRVQRSRTGSCGTPKSSLYNIARQNGFKIWNQLYTEKSP